MRPIDTGVVPREILVKVVDKRAVPEFQEARANKKAGNVIVVSLTKVYQ